MTEPAESVELRIATLERRAIRIRIGATVWGAWTVITFGYLGIARPVGYSAEEGWPIYLGGAGLSLLFLAAVSWRPWRDVEEWIDRVSMMLQWQVGAGAVIAFTIAIGSRAELLIPFGTYGLYLFLFAGIAMAMRLAESALRRRYSERARARDLARRAAELHAIVLAIRAEARPRWFRRSLRRPPVA